MYYFDNKLLQGYIDQKRPLKVFGQDRWFSVADQNDLRDDLTCCAYDQYGKASYIDYRDITQIKVGPQTYNLEQLQAFMTQKPAEGKESKPKAEPDAEGEEPMPDEEPAKEKEPDLSWFSPAYEIGRNLIQEKRKQK